MDSVPFYVMALSDAAYQKCKTKFVNAGFKNPIHHFNAVDGKKMRTELVDDRSKLSFRAMTEIEHSKERETHSSMPSWGGVGCYLSHVALWEKAKEGGLFIIEEDAGPVSGAADTMRKEFEEVQALKDDNYIYWPGYIGARFTEPVGSTKFKKAKGVVYGAQMYYVSPAGAESLLKNAFPMEVQVDSYMGYVFVNNLVSAYLSPSPLVVQQNVTGTTIQTKRVGSNDSGLTAKKDNLMTRTNAGIAVLFGILVFFLLFWWWNQSSRTRKNSFTEDRYNVER